MIFQTPSNLLLGAPVLAAVMDRAIKSELMHEKQVVIIRYSPPLPQSETFLASDISVNAKTKAFKKVGLKISEIILHEETSIPDFQKHLGTIENTPSILGFILQRPVPKRFDENQCYLESRKNLDGPGGIFSGCAVAEAIFRIAKPFFRIDSSVVLIGGKGFVGKETARLLHHANIPFANLDLGDDLSGVKEGNLIISATGHANLLNESHFSQQNEVVLDAGFSVKRTVGEITIFGDVNRNAYPFLRYVTPVPGGIGPMQISVLIERVMKMAGSDLENRVQGLN